MENKTFVNMNVHMYQFICQSHIQIMCTIWTMHKYMSKMSSELFPISFYFNNMLSTIFAKIMMAIFFHLQ